MILMLQAWNFAAVCLDSSSHLFCNYKNPLPIGLRFDSRNSWLVKGLSNGGRLARNDVKSDTNSRAIKGTGNRILLPVT